MDAKLKERIIKVAIWLVAEITLSLVGMDTMADYSEFVFGQEPVITYSAQAAISSTIA